MTADGRAWVWKRAGYLRPHVSPRFARPALSLVLGCGGDGGGGAAAKLPQGAQPTAADTARQVRLEGALNARDFGGASRRLAHALAFFDKSCGHFVKDVTQ